MTEGPFGLPRPFAESKPILKIVMEEEAVQERAESLGIADNSQNNPAEAELYSEVLLNVEEELGFDKTDSLALGGRTDHGYEKQRGMVHFGYNLSGVDLDDVAELRGVINGTMGNEIETFFEVR